MKTVLKQIIITAIIAIGIWGCNESWLDVEPKGQVFEVNYYKNSQEAYSALVACYDVMQHDFWPRGGWATKRGNLCAAADECAGGGGGVGDFIAWVTWDNFTLSASTGPSLGIWDQNFTGVYRTNLLISKIDGVPSMADSERKRYKAEAKFLRARFYFDLVTFFKNVPLFTEPLELENAFKQPQADPKLVYKQIEKDLNEAIPNLPTILPASESGRTTQGAAKALLGKVILFQMDQSRMLEAAAIFEDVNKDDNIYGYKLQKKYGDIFKVSNKFNSESIFEIVHSNVLGTAANMDNGEGSLWSQAIGPRGYTGPTYFAGWGANPVEMSLVNDLKGDPRYSYTVVNIDSIAKNNTLANYEPGYQNSGYFIAKWMLRQADIPATGNEWVNWPYDFIEIRLADTYLMEAEALLRGNGDKSKASKYLNAVRTRVGLSPVEATLENIFKERRLELAIEGSRYFDILRFGKASEILGPKGFVVGKNEILPIPLSELNNTNLIQNPNYQ